jgi:hypothetical protein
MLRSQCIVLLLTCLLQTVYIVINTDLNLDKYPIGVFNKLAHSDYAQNTGMALTRLHLLKYSQKDEPQQQREHVHCQLQIELAVKKNCKIFSTDD